MSITKEDKEIKIKKAINSVLIEYIGLEEKEEAKELNLLEEDLVTVHCFNSKCSGKIFLVKKEFKKKRVTCPHCGNVYSVRYFKNKKINVAILKDLNKED